MLSSSSLRNLVDRQLISTTSTCWPSTINQSPALRVPRSSEPGEDVSKCLLKNKPNDDRDHSGACEQSGNCNVIKEGEPDEISDDDQHQSHNLR